MSASNIQKDENDYGQVLDVPRLIEAVRGSRAARVLFELRPWLPRSGDPTVVERASIFRAAPTDELDCLDMIQP
jgi:hypothetical protein